MNNQLDLSMLREFKLQNCIGKELLEFDQLNKPNKKNYRHTS